MSSELYLRLESQMQAAVPFGLLLGAATIALLCFLLCLVAWRRAAGRNRALERRLSEASATLAKANKALESEIKWRLATDQFAAETSKASPGHLESKSTRALQELLVAEGFDGKKSE